MLQEVRVKTFCSQPSDESPPTKTYVDTRYGQCAGKFRGMLVYRIAYVIPARGPHFAFLKYQVTSELITHLPIEMWYHITLKPIIHTIHHKIYTYIHKTDPIGALTSSCLLQFESLVL